MCDVIKYIELTSSSQPLTPTFSFLSFQDLQSTGTAAVASADDSFLDNLIFNTQTVDTSSSSTSTTTGRTQEPRPTSDHELRQGSVTGTPKPPTTELDDIFISVKTTKNYHDSRLSLIIKTWFQLAKTQVRKKGDNSRCVTFLGLQ